MRHIVALSGGKDSTALALRLAEVEPRQYTYVVTPTGDELPDVVDHWLRLGRLLGAPLVPLTQGVSLNGLVERFHALPNWRQRWCTRILKVEPFLAFALAHRPATVYVGLRADEDREGVDYGAVDGLTKRYPLAEWGWGVRDVVSYLHARRVTVPPRTDCARCFFQTLGEWYNLWATHPATYAEAEAQEVAVGHTFRSPGRDTWPASLRELRARFEAGAVPVRHNRRGGGCRICTL